MMNTYMNRNNLVALTTDQMRRVAPSIFAEDKHASRSARYSYIPTVQVVEAMQREGFVPVSAQQSRCRIEGKSEFTKHMVKFVLAGALETLGNQSQTGMTGVPQVSLVNSHDGTSGYKLFAGMLRLACLNGLLVCNSELDSVSIRHSGDVLDKVIDGSFQVIDHAKEAAKGVEAWRAITCRPNEQEAFARAALTLRYPDVTEGVAAPISPVQVLKVRRMEDRENDLWTTFNRVQENLIRGGSRYQVESGRMQRSRAVTGIDQSTALNRALWQLAEEFKTLKMAA